MHQIYINSLPNVTTPFNLVYINKISKYMGYYHYNWQINSQLNNANSVPKNSSSRPNKKGGHVRLTSALLTINDEIVYLIFHLNSALIN